ncbi:MAG: hypothetical protein QOF60_2685 [Actinomycetota bacterium]|jgi:hypothetical protein|nr:hypothetical protein [Actinomycetota bacterium]
MRLTLTKATLVVLLAVLGPLAFLSIHPAAAEPACADVWIEHSDGSRAYLTGPDNCVETPFTQWVTVIVHDHDPWWPPGWPAGAGFAVILTSPV